MNTIGTASHLKNIPARIAIARRIIFGRLFFMERSLNFNAINERLLTINQLTSKVTPYKNHLFNNNCETISLLLNQYIKGMEAINKPAAGEGIPLKTNCCVVSTLNFARRYAAAQGKINAGNNQSTEASKPFGCCIKPMRRN